MISMFSEVWKKATKNYNKAITDKIPYLVEFGMAVTKPKSPKKSPPIKKSPKIDKTNKTIGQTVGINEAPSGKASPTSKVAVPPYE